MIRIYNSQAREKREFVPIEEGKVRMYVCGPTVYDRDPYRQRPHVSFLRRHSPLVDRKRLRSHVRAEPDRRRRQASSTAPTSRAARPKRLPRSSPTPSSSRCDAST